MFPFYKLGYFIICLFVSVKEKHKYRTRTVLTLCGLERAFPVKYTLSALYHVIGIGYPPLVRTLSGNGYYSTVKTQYADMYLLSNNKKDEVMTFVFSALLPSSLHRGRVPSYPILALAKRMSVAGETYR
jgi:hypothetical protein